MKIKTKIHLFSTVWLLLILLLINLAVYFLFERIANNNELERMELQTATVAEALKPREDVKVRPADLLRAYLPANGMIRVTTSGDTPLVTVTRNGFLGDLPASFSTKHTSEIMRVEEHTLAVVSSPIIWSDGSVASLTVVENLAFQEKSLDLLKLVLLLASIIILLPSFLAGRMLGQLIIKPIYAMTSAMEDVRGRKSFKKIELNEASKDELFTMGTSFNRMIDLLHSNHEKQQQFVSDASHELKTPLTVIESYAKMLKRWGMRKPEVLEESVDTIYSEAVRMRELTNQMLELASSENEWDVQLEPTALSTLCENAVKHFTQAYERQIGLSMPVAPVTIYADEQRLKQVLVILLDNAVKYSSGTIEVTLGVENGEAVIQVNDHGIGIPEEDLDKVFDRFYRVDRVRTEGKGGTGLGLPIAKRLVEAHNGTIRVLSVEGVGTTFVVRLPA